MFKDSELSIVLDYDEKFSFILQYKGKPFSIWFISSVIKRSCNGIKMENVLEI